MRLKVFLFGLLLLLTSGELCAQRQRRAIPAVNAGRTLTVLTEPNAPNAVVWLDEIRRGATDAAGRLAALKVSAGAHTLRVRAAGFKEITSPVTAVSRGEIKVL